MTNVFISDASSGTVGYRCADDYGTEIVREFWVASSGGAVHEVSLARGGSTGPQVCKHLRHRGYTLQSTRATLLALIRSEVRAVKRLEAKEALHYA